MIPLSELHTVAYLNLVLCAMVILSGYMYHRIKKTKEEGLNKAVDEICWVFIALLSMISLVWFNIFIILDIGK